MWYLRGHNAKFGVDVSHLNKAPINGLDLQPGDAGWLMRSQFQLAF